MEKLLSEAFLSKDVGRQEAATYNVLRVAVNACWHIHHFADLMFCRVKGRAAKRGEMKQYILAIQERGCDNGQFKKSPNEMMLLCDVADALKHGMLHDITRMVSATDQVIVVSEAGTYGTGKDGGVPQVWILLKDAKRPLLTVLENVVNAWAAEIDVIMEKFDCRSP